MKKPLIFINGKMVLASPADLRALTPGAINKYGVFETMRACQGRIFFFKEHWDRFCFGLRKLKIKISYSPNEINTISKVVLNANHLDEARLRWEIWREKKIVRFAIVALPYAELSKQKFRRGLKSVIVPVRIDRAQGQSRVKSLFYTAYFKAYKLAKEKKCDEAILLNRQGFLAEGSRSNIFVIRKNILLTPALSCGCLKGITRQCILKIAKEKRIICREKNLTEESLFNAQEAFLTNSLWGIIPITFVNGKMIAKGKPGEITSLLSKRYKHLAQQYLA
ncbi:MAG: aminotransferase class IV [Candidatus Omnitrophota bacterium]